MVEVAGVDFFEIFSLSESVSSEELDNVFFWVPLVSFTFDFTFFIASLLSFFTLFDLNSWLESVPISNLCSWYRFFA